MVIDFFSTKRFHCVARRMLEASFGENHEGDCRDGTIDRVVASEFAGSTMIAEVRLSCVKFHRAM